MPTLINAYALYDGTTGVYVGDQGLTISITCDRLNSYSPRPVWLKRFAAPGDGTLILFEPTFNPTSAELLDPNTLSGWWIQVDGKDTMIDAASLNAFQQACDACCGSVPTIVANIYNGAPPAFQPLTLNQLCIYRYDDGSAYSVAKFSYDYVGQFVGYINIRSNFSGISHYTISTYWGVSNFPLIGTDTVYLGACSS